jgi:hypothetical protein
MEREREDQFVEELISSLLKASNSSDKVWQERYMKGVITYRGVKVPKVRNLVSMLDHLLPSSMTLRNDKLECFYMATCFHASLIFPY